MTRIKLLLGLLIFIVHSCVFAESVTIAAPYYMEEDSKLGQHLLTIEKALATQGMQLNVQFLSNQQIIEKLSNAEINGGFISEKEILSRFYSVNYHFDLTPVAISLRSKALAIKQEKDLESRHIVAFENAQNLLSDAFKQIVQNNRYYKEVDDQSYQVRMLFTKRTEIIVLGKAIFDYYFKKLPSPYQNMEYEVHEFMPEKSLVTLVFNQQHLKYAFEAGLAELQQDPSS